MKRIITWGVLIITLSFSQNLLPNPGFENWTGGMPDYWFKDDSILVYQEDVIVHSGNFSVKDSLITTTQDRADFFSARFAIRPNTRYTFSIWVYDNDPAGRVRQAIAWRVGGTWSNVWSNNFSINSTEWQQLVFTAVAPNGADSAYVFVRAYDSLQAWDGGAVFYIDDASFTPPSTQAPVIVRAWHTPTNPNAGAQINVYAKVSDDGIITADTLFYGINNLNTPIKISHSAITNDTFRFQIPGQSSGDTVFYYFKFTDNDNLTTFSDTYAIYVGRINLYINEVYYDSPGTDSGCYIELFGTPMMNLNGFTLVGVNGSGGIPYATINLSGYSMPNDGFFVIAQNSWVPNADLIDPNADLQNGPDNLELRFNNIVIDALGYGILDGWVFTGEWLPAVDVSFGHSLGRYPDGDDTDNNYVDFHDYDTLTPGTSNPAVGIVENNDRPSQKRMLRNPVLSKMKFSEILPESSCSLLFVYDITGRLVKKVENINEEINLNTGIYFLRSVVEKEKILKIIVVK
ncbi:MAG: carbohydrate binding domain-containing protein [candidate division WOR-3 bacterium]|nr:carbohydrate binding domain-containing protein [candidate division WOR-3 bacterium]